MSVNLQRQLKYIYAGAATRRFHTHPMHEYQTVGAHSFGVAALYGLLAGGAATVQGYRAALYHDLAEQYVGDIPAPVKRAIPGLRDDLSRREGELNDRMLGSAKLSAEDVRLVKLADAMDGALHCVAERAKGNSFVESIYSTFRRYMRELGDYTEIDLPTRQSILLAAIDDAWRHACSGHDPFVWTREIAE